LDKHKYESFKETKENGLLQPMEIQYNLECLKYFYRRKKKIL